MMPHARPHQPTEQSTGQDTSQYTRRRALRITGAGLALAAVPAVAHAQTTATATTATATGATATGGTATGAGATSANAASTTTASTTTASTITIPALPSARAAELDRTQDSLSASELRTTGLYLAAGTALNIVVHRGLVPTLVVGAPDADARTDFKSPREYPLQLGRNTITDAGGGVVYLKLIGDTGQAKVTIGEQAQPMPYFVLGCTGEAEFQRQLDERNTPYVELVSPHATITVERASALTYRGENHTDLLSTYEDVIRIEDSTSGYDGSAPVHARLVHRYHFVGYPSAITGVGAYTTHGHMSFPPPIQDRMLTVEGLRMRGWGIYHELGHQHQQITYKPSSLTEVTVNMYSLAVNAVFATKYGQQPRLHAPDAKTGLTPWESAPGKLRSPNVNYGTTFDPYEKLVMFEQLRLAFGNAFWPNLHKLVRVERPYAGDYTDEALRLRNLVVLCSRTAGHDLSDFFRAWGVPVDAEAIAQLTGLHLTPPPTDPSTIRE